MRHPQHPPPSPPGGHQQGPPQYRQEPRTVYQTPIAHTAPAPYPYAGGAAPDPRAVGPSWAAPAAHRPGPAPAYQHPPQAQARRPEPSAPRHVRQPSPMRNAPAKPGLLRRVFSFFVSVFAFLVLLVGGAFVILAILGQRGLLTLSEEDLPVVLPEQPIAIPDRTPLLLKPDKIAETLWTTGTCGDFSNERDLPAYQVGKNSGSAGALRGKTAALVIKLHSPQMVWTKATELNVDRAAIMTQRFYLAQAQGHAIGDLKFDVIPWALRTAYSLPALNLDKSQRLPSATMDLIRETSRHAIETALGARMERIIGELRKDGYANVAFFISFPIKTKARNFAVPSYRSAPKEFPEAAYLFAPTTDLGHFAVTMAHEGMHLFGADDLYRIKVPDRRDDDDVMGEYCTGFKKAKVGDSTAFAIGWKAAPPARAYGFEIK